jgi:integrase
VCLTVLDLTLPLWERRKTQFLADCVFRSHLTADSGAKGRAKEFYDHETFERLVVTASKLAPRFYAVILLAGDARLRRGETIGVNLTDLDFKRGRISK